MDCWIFAGLRMYIVLLVICDCVGHMITGLYYVVVFYCMYVIVHLLIFCLGYAWLFLLEVIVLLDCLMVFFFTLICVWWCGIAWFWLRVLHKVCVYVCIWFVLFWVLLVCDLILYYVRLRFGLLDLCFWLFTLLIFCGLKQVHLTLIVLYEYY